MHPISVRFDDYSGDVKSRQKKASEWNRVALLVQTELRNMYDEIAPGASPVAIFSHTIAHKLNEESDLVNRIVCSHSGGSTGATFWKPDASGKLNENVRE